MLPKQLNAFAFHFIPLTFMDGLLLTIIEENDCKNLKRAWKMLMIRFPWKRKGCALEWMLWF